MPGKPKLNSQARAKDERFYDGQYRQELRRLGASCWKLEPKHVRGWPDVYVAPDIHLEFKYISWFGAPTFKPQQHFEPLQKQLLSEIARKGGRCFAGVFWWFGEEGGYIQTIDWATFLKAPPFSREYVRKTAHPLTNMRQHIADTWEIIDGRPSIRSSAVDQVFLAQRTNPIQGHPD